MKLLLDQNISFRLTKKLQNYFPGCLHISDCGLRDCEDQEIWEYSQENDFAIVTFDSDFYDISIINGHPPKIIWIRTGNLATDGVFQLMIKNQMAINNFLNNDSYKDMACLELEMPRKP